MSITIRVWLTGHKLTTSKQPDLNFRAMNINVFLWFKYPACVARSGRGQQETQTDTNLCARCDEGKCRHCLTEEMIILHQHVTAESEKLWPLTSCIHLSFIYYCKLDALVQRRPREGNNLRWRRGRRRVKLSICSFSFHRRFQTK